MKHIQPNRFSGFIIIGLMAAFLVSCKKSSGSDNNPTLKTPLVTSVDMEQLQSSTLFTRSSLLFDYSDTKLTKVHTYQNGVEIGYAQLEYGTVDDISYIEHRTINVTSPYGGGSGSDILNYREDFTYNQDGNLDTYSTRSFFYGNGYNVAPDEYIGSKESYTYNSDGSVSVKVYGLSSINGTALSEVVAAIGTKVISFPSPGVKKVAYTNTAAPYTATYTYNYDSKNNPFKNITGSFQKLWVTPSYGVGSFDSGIIGETDILGDIFNANNLLNFTGDTSTGSISPGKFDYTYNADNYPTTGSSPNFILLTFHYN